MKKIFLITALLLSLSSCELENQSYDTSKVSKLSDGQQNVQPAKIERTETGNTIPEVPGKMPEISNK